MRASALLSVLLVAVPAAAQAFEGARLLATSGSQRSQLTSNDAIYVNPAGIGLARSYSIEANAQDDLGDFETLFNASIVDSQAGPLAGGLAYVYTDRKLGETADGDRKQFVHRVDLALATRIAETAAIGVSGRYITLAEATGDSEAEGYDLFTIDAGFQWQSSVGFSLGLAAYNLTNPERTDAPISWGGGLGYVLSDLSLAADIRYNAQIGKPRFSGAVTYAIGGLVPLRVGTAFDRADESWVVSGGIGYQQQNFGIDIGYRERVVHGALGVDALERRMLGAAMRIMVF